MANRCQDCRKWLRFPYKYEFILGIHVENTKVHRGSYASSLSTTFKEPIPRAGRPVTGMVQKTILNMETGKSKQIMVPTTIILNCSNYTPTVYSHLGCEYFELRKK